MNASDSWAAALVDSQVRASTEIATREELDSYHSSAAPQVYDLSNYAVYGLKGDDATDFLQGQFCNDIANVSAEQAQITGYCTPKGRLLALPILVGAESGYRMLVPEEVSEAFIKRLSMFVMRSDVTITALDDWLAMGLAIPESEPTEEQPKEQSDAAAVLPVQPAVGTLAVNSSESSQLISWHDDLSGKYRRSRYIHLAPIEQQLSLWQSSSAEHRSSHCWRLANISAGIPSVTSGIVEAFVPQMINLQLINALSFTKGCYPGQEIVARMQYLGKLKRHMQVFSMPIEALADEQLTDILAPGNPLGCGDDKNAGVIVDAMPCTLSKAMILAVTKTSVAGGEFAVSDIPLEPVKMPYELPSLNNVA